MVGYLVMKGPSPREPVPDLPKSTVGTGKPDPAPKPAPGAGKKKPPKEPAPLEPAVPATKEGRLAFLQRFAGPAAPPKDGRMIFLFPAVRADALEALENLPGHDASPLVLAALGGDGIPEAWSEDRLVAAGIRARQGHPDGPETVRAFLKSEEDLAVADGLGAAARAAGWMGKEGGAVVQRLLSLDLEDLDEEDLAEFLRAAAVLGEGATKEGLIRFVAADPGTWEPLVLGAASGALLKQGDLSGRKALDALREDDWFGAEDFALGLGARGNAAAVPWLKEMLGADSEWTQAAAAAALAVVGGDEAKAALRGALADPADDVNRQAAVSLALLGDRSGIEKVRLAAHSKDPDLAIPAWKALALLGDEGWKEEAGKILSTPWPSAADARSAPETRKRVWAALLMLKLER
jgi:hypothetical protein